MLDIHREGVTSTGERLASRPTILDIRYLTDEHKTLIASHIAKHDGHISVFAHPFFENDRSLADPYEDNQMYFHSNRVKDHIRTSTGVIFIFEGNNNWDSTKFKANLLQSKAIVVMIPAMNARPTPQHLDTRFANEETQWIDVLNQLQGFGVKDATVGGRELYYKQGKPGGCVFWLYEKFAERFNTTYDYDLCYPNTSTGTSLSCKGTYAGFGV
jgi:hypothetical protein